MGNKNSRTLTKPKDRGNECVCDMFLLAAACDHGSLKISLSTDLPINTKVKIQAQRLFPATGGHNWYWTCLDETYSVKKMEVGPNGLVVEVTIDALDSKGINMYRHLKGKMDVTIAAPPSIALEILVEAPNKPHHFGICNRRLTGKAVQVTPHGHSLQQLIQIDVPLSETVMKKLGFYVPVA